MSSLPHPLTPEALRSRFADRSAAIAVIGLGYVGLPLVFAIHAAGFRALGFDIDAGKVAQLSAGRSYLNTVPDSAIAALNQTGRFAATADFVRLGEADAILI